MPIVGTCTTCKTPSAISLGHSLLNLLSDFRTPNNFDRHFHTRKSKKQIDRIETIVCLKTMPDVRVQLTTINCAMRCDDTNFGWPNQKNELGVPTHWSEEADLRVKIWSRFIAQRSQWSWLTTFFVSLVLAIPFYFAFPHQPQWVS